MNLIDRTLWLVIMLLAMMLSAATLLIGYISLYQLAARQWEAAMIGLLVSTTCVGATLTLCRHRQDLV